MPFETLQADFAAALLDRDRPMPAGLTAWHGQAPERRFALHRRNAAAGLARALASRFPATEKLVGAEFFAAMAGLYVVRHPPRSPVLLQYGDDLADFVVGFEPAADLPYLPDVVRLEAARSRAYHAADVTPLASAALQDRSGADLAALGLDLHPATAILRSPHPIVTLWAMNAGEMPLEPIDDWAGEDALVVRPGLSVLVQRLAPGATAFLEALAAGATLGAAAEAGLAEASGFDLGSALGDALKAGAFAAIRP
jgi:hypothetical protein